MHPWKKIIRGKTEELKTRSCFMCLEKIVSAEAGADTVDDDRELKLHLFSVHSVKIHMEELVQFCADAEKREEREGWRIDDILEEEGKRFDARERSAESGGWLLRKKKQIGAEIDCFLCQEKLTVKSCEYDKHLEKYHDVMFGLSEIKKAEEKDEILQSKEEPDIDKDEAETEMHVVGEVGTDAESVKELSS